jgi:hypothetical protein
MYKDTKAPFLIYPAKVQERDALAERIFLARLTAASPLGAPSGDSEIGNAVCLKAYEWADHWLSYKYKQHAGCYQKQHKESCSGL